ncbi:MAG: hypothetical protein CL607_23625 [Anaerolineaceae bacterium]|nr:hypothetical protein [Anaerolineaceae bacterium]
MSVTVERLEGEPILIATMRGYITYADVREVYRLSKALITVQDNKIYRITDVWQADSSFTEMLKVIQRATQEVAASTEDTRIQVVFVGAHSWIQFFRNTMQNRGIDIAVFTDMDKALQAVHLMIANDRETG